MRILIVNRNYGSSYVPTGRMAKDLVRQIHNDGHEVTVLTAKSFYTKKAEGHQTSKEARIINVLTFGERLRFVSWMLFLVQACLIAPFLKWDRCVILTDPPFLVLTTIFINLFIERRVYWWTMDLYPESLVAEEIIRPKGLFARFFMAINNACIKKLAGVIVLGYCQRKRLTAYLNWPKDDEKFCLVQPPWDYRSINFVEKSENRFIANEGLTGKKILLYAGNLGRAHSYKELLETARLMVESDDDWQFVFVCRGAMRAGLEEDAADLSNVTVLDYQPVELTADLLWSADIHVITMKQGWEGVVVPSKLYSVLQTQAPVLFIGPDDADTATEIRRLNVGDTLEGSTSPEQIMDSIQRLSKARPQGRQNYPNREVKNVSRFIIGNP